MKSKKPLDELRYSTSVALYRHDLDDILSILSRACKQVTIKDKRYEYQSFEQLQDKRGINPRHLSITSREPDVTLNVRMKASTTTLVGSGDGSKPYVEIEEILKAQRRKGMDFILSGMPLLVLASFVSFAWSWFNIQFSNSFTGFWIRIFLTILFLIVSSLALALYRRGALSTISLNKEHERISFWLKYREKILIGILSAVAGAGLPTLIKGIISRF